MCPGGGVLTVPYCTTNRVSVRPGSYAYECLGLPYQDGSRAFIKYGLKPMVSSGRYVLQVRHGSGIAAADDAVQTVWLQVNKTLPKRPG